MGGLSRRRLLGLAATAAAAPLLPRAAVAAPSAPPIVRRSTWGPDLLPTGPLQAEDDVRFLLVHHTADANGYAAGEVVERLRGYVRFHTEARGWPDLAYNFLVDAYGVAYEGRTGSADGPVRGDATGGSQGHAILCAFIGDHSVEPPTEPAQQTMVALLAWQAGLHRLDPRASTTFTSRGSNLHPPGVEVTTSVIAGHRDMSLTTCPGDAAYALVRGALPDRVAAFLAAGAAGAPPGTPPSVELADVPTPTPTATPIPTSVPTSSPTPPAVVATTEAPEPLASIAKANGDDAAVLLRAAAGALIGLTAVGAAVVAADQRARDLSDTVPQADDRGAHAEPG